MTDHPAAKWFGQCEEILIAQEQLFRCEQRPFAICFQEFVPRLGIGPEALDRRVDVTDQREHGVFRQVLEQCRGFLKKQRQVVLDAGRCNAAADILVDHRLCRVAFEHFAPAAAECGTRRLVHRKFAPGQHAYFLDGIERTLRIRIEGTDRFNRLTEQIDPIGQCRSHREQINQAAAHRIFTGRHDLRYMGIAGQRQLRFQPRFVQCFALLEKERIGGKEGGWRHAYQCGGRWHDQHIAMAILHFIQCCQSFRYQILMRRKRIVGESFPIGQQMTAQCIFLAAEP